MFEEIFSRKKLIPERLINYGFESTDGIFCKTQKILDGEFVLTVTFDGQGKVDTALAESDSGEEYSLYKTAAQGAFVGEVRAAITEILEDVAKNCFMPAVYKQPQTLRIIEFINKKFGGELEFLWQNFPDYAVWRRKDTNKWYGLLAVIPKNKLGEKSNEIVEIIDLRAPTDKMDELIHSGFYRGWHMNKKSWFTAILDGSVPDDTLQTLIEQSYNLAGK